MVRTIQQIGITMYSHRGCLHGDVESVLPPSPLMVPYVPGTGRVADPVLEVRHRCPCSPLPELWSLIAVIYSLDSIHPVFLKTFWSLDFASNPTQNSYSVGSNRYS
jgi:hypothetical protein